MFQNSDKNIVPQNGTKLSQSNQAAGERGGSGDRGGGLGESMESNSMLVEQAMSLLPGLFGVNQGNQGENMDLSAGNFDAIAAAIVDDAQRGATRKSSRENSQSKEGQASRVTNAIAPPKGTPPGLEGKSVLPLSYSSLQALASGRVLKCSGDAIAASVQLPVQQPSGPGQTSPKGELQVINVNKVEEGEDNRTTIMIKKLPRKYTMQMLREEIDSFRELVNSYDLLYLPMDTAKLTNRGYAFINLRKPMNVARFCRAFDGHIWRRFNLMEKRCEICFAHIQGREETINHINSEQPAGCGSSQVIAKDQSAVSAPVNSIGSGGVRDDLAQAQSAAFGPLPPPKFRSLGQPTVSQGRYKASPLPPSGRSHMTSIQEQGEGSALLQGYDSFPTGQGVPCRPSNYGNFGSQGFHPHRLGQMDSIQEVEQTYPQPQNPLAGNLTSAQLFQALQAQLAREAQSRDGSGNTQNSEWPMSYIMSADPCPPPSASCRCPLSLSGHTKYPSTP